MNPVKEIVNQLELDVTNPEDVEVLDYMFDKTQESFNVDSETIKGWYKEVGIE